jgi:hypothetical protein
LSELKSSIGSPSNGGITDCYCDTSEVLCYYYMVYVWLTYNIQILHLLTHLFHSIRLAYRVIVLSCTLYLLLAKGTTLYLLSVRSWNSKWISHRSIGWCCLKFRLWCLLIWHVVVYIELNLLCWGIPIHLIKISILK